MKEREAAIMRTKTHDTNVWPKVKLEKKKRVQVNLCLFKGGTKKYFLLQSMLMHGEARA